MILLDTSVVSLVFRRARSGEPEPEVVEVVRRMIRDDVPLTIPGIVLQEVLSGVRTEAQFVRLQNLLGSFPVLLADPRDHLAAARIANACRRMGVATSAVDCLISALATERDAPLFTLDRDFVRIAPHCGLKLFSGVEEPRSPH